MDSMKNIIDNVAAKAPEMPERAVKGDDGLFYCPVCKKPLQVKITIFDTERIVRCVCRCEREEEERKEEAIARRDFMRKVDRLRRAGFPDEEMQRWKFETDDGSNEKLTKTLHAYVDKFDTFAETGKGLLLWGSVGTGKTFAAACIANALIDKGVPVLMTNFARLANTLQGMFSGRQEYIDKLCNFPLLIIDDLAAERRTEYMQEIIFNIIDSRYRSGKPMIITTNLTLQEIKSPSNVADGRCFDRILERCFPLEVNGASRRRKKIVADYEKTKTLLGL